MRMSRPLAVLTGALLAQSSIAQVPQHQQQNSWFSDARSLVEARAARSENPEKAKNVILFIGDGMGVSTLTAARIYEGQSMPGNQGGEEHSLVFERFPYSALVKTYNTNQQTPDSAGTATAIMSGVKTKAGLIGLAEDSPRGDCAASQGYELTSVLELAEQQGLATGVVTTTTITHATPASAYAHTPDRDWEVDSDMPEEAAECKDIAAQLVEFSHGDGIDVAFGGGRAFFLPEDMEDADGNAGAREDGRDLVSEWLDASGGTYVTNAGELEALDSGSGQVLGLFHPSYMNFDVDRDTSDAGEPSISEMTEKAVQLLSGNEQGYFLLVEGGRIDHGHHFVNAARALSDTVSFAAAVQWAVDNTDPAETLIIVTADHSHGFTMAGYPQRGNPILGKVHGVDSSGAPEAEPDLALDGMPYTTLGYANGMGFAEDAGGLSRLFAPAAPGRHDLTHVDTEHHGFHQETLVPMLIETHAGEDVALHASGPSAHLFRGVIEQNSIFHVMNQALSLGVGGYREGE